MSVIVKTGSTLRVADDADIQILDVLPPKVFVVGADMSGLFLREITDFSLPPKLYGSTEKDADRIIQAFDNRDMAMGVHLDGMKGSGKTLLTKVVANKMAERNAPTILVNEPFAGDGFNSFIQSIEQEAVIIFDEFEKIFDAAGQSKVLTLLDGVYPSRKLFMITTNEDRKVSDYMKNRPGRVYYKMAFNRLEDDFIRDFVDDRLVNTDHRTELLIFTKLYPNLNFDMLNAVVNEMNDFGETVRDALRYLNVKPETTSYATYDITMIVKNAAGETCEINLHDDSEFSPMDGYVYFGSANCFKKDDALLAAIIGFGVEDFNYGLAGSRVKNLANKPETVEYIQTKKIVDSVDEILASFAHDGSLKDPTLASVFEGGAAGNVITNSLHMCLRKHFPEEMEQESFSVEHMLVADVDNDTFIYGLGPKPDGSELKIRAKKRPYVQKNSWAFF